MEIWVNNSPLQVGETASIPDVLEHLNIVSHIGIAVALNDAVVQKAAWSQTVLQHNDKITLIKATQGG
jgi:sulfur carrier protein